MCLSVAKLSENYNSGFRMTQKGLLKAQNSKFVGLPSKNLIKTLNGKMDIGTSRHHIATTFIAFFKSFWRKSRDPKFPQIAGTMHQVSLKLMPAKPG